MMMTMMVIIILLIIIITRRRRAVISIELYLTDKDENTALYNYKIKV